MQIADTMIPKFLIDPVSKQIDAVRTVLQKELIRLKSVMANRSCVRKATCGATQKGLLESTNEYPPCSSSFAQSGHDPNYRLPRTSLHKLHYF